MLSSRQVIPERFAVGWLVCYWAVCLEVICWFCFAARAYSGRGNDGKESSNGASISYMAEMMTASRRNVSRQRDCAEVQELRKRTTRDCGVRASHVDVRGILRWSLQDYNQLGLRIFISSYGTLRMRCALQYRSTPLSDHVPSGLRSQTRPKLMMMIMNSLRSQLPLPRYTIRGLSRYYSA